MIFGLGLHQLIDQCYVLQRVHIVRLLGLYNVL